MLDLKDFPEKQLTMDEEAALAKTGDLESLVLHNMREAFKYGFRCARGNLADGVVLSACYLALRDAAKNFKPGPTRFFAYAKAYVRGKLIVEFKGEYVVKNSKGSTSLLCIVEPVAEPGLDEHDDRPSRGTDWNTNDTFGEIPLFPMSEQPAAGSHSDEWARIKVLIGESLNEEERMVLELRYNGDMTFEKIGELIDKSKTWAAQLHENALTKIRAQLARQKVSKDTL